MALKYLCLVLCVTFFAMEVHGRNEYVAYKRAINFYEAFQQCRLYGGHLASIESADENARVVTAVKAAGDFSKDWLIGATDLGNEGTFIWTGVNRKATYLNFNGGEPSNNDGSEHCVAIGSTAGSKWNDVPCNAKVEGFVCAYIRL
ncbi:perlucin-like protein [Anopheles stephensi]|uniref:C-type lectin domain-containing protein n=1 Tax=Anopheles stephensi TaxID=30069 RepID=A0A182Y9N8_ANOST|nr:perlucin-like protein [Anopheles stephensi]